MQVQSKYTLLLGSLAVSSFAVAAQPTSSSWAAFNGFAPGMTKAAAKAAGYTACRFGKGLSERSDSVYCEIPNSKRALGSLSANTALIEFRSHNAEVVGEMHLTFEAKVDAVLAALTARYGRPIEGGQHYSWNRNGPESVQLSRRQRTSTAYVTYAHDKSLGEARQKAARDAEKKKATLKGF
jgi:hypothetical protein